MKDKGNNCIHRYKAEDIEKIQQIKDNIFELRKMSQIDLMQYYSECYELFLIYLSYDDSEKAACLFQDYIDLIMENYDSKEVGLLSVVYYMEENVKYYLLNAFLKTGYAYTKCMELEKSKFAYETGYFISACSFGEENEFTLRFCMCLAMLEMAIDFDGGMRELKYVYDDMRKYLGEDNKYTNYVKELLQKNQKS